MAQALYRKYRSRSLDELVGQEHITTTLAAAVQSGRISHAYLFTGPRGTGKTSVARILAHQINQLPYSDKPHLDIIEIDAASNRRIDDIRDLREKVHLAPTSAPYKVYIIDEVHMLTGESFNALLKTLEEPPSHVVFILATTEVHKLPATIISRTQRYSFRPMDLAKGMAHLKQVAAQEDITVDDASLRLIAEHGAGSFRDSMSLLDQLANTANGTITTDIVEQTLGLAPQELLSELMGALNKGDHQQLVASLQKLEAHGANTTALLPQLLRAVQAEALTSPALYPLLDALLEVPRAYSPQIKLLTTLVAFASTNHSAKPPVSKAAAVQAPKPPFEIAKKPSDIKKELTEPAPEPPIEAADQTDPHPTTHFAEFTVEHWATVLQSLQASSPPLYSVLKQAEPIFDSAEQTLTIASRYRLHLKKLEDAKFKTELVKAMTQTLGGAPIIKTEHKLDAQPLDLGAVKAAAAPLSETSQAVAAIMGGGEAV